MTGPRILPTSDSSTPIFEDTSSPQPSTPQNQTDDGPASNSAAPPGTTLFALEEAADWKAAPEPLTERLGDRYVSQDVVENAGSLIEVRQHPQSAVVGGHRPSVVADVLDLGGLVVGAVSIRGAAHYDSRTVRQDAYSLGSTEDGRYLVAAVADGVSEGKFSHLGAEWACQQGVILAKQELSQSGDCLQADWGKVGSALREEVRNRAIHHLGEGFLNSDGDRVQSADVPDSVFARAMGTTSELLVVDTIPDADDAFVALRIVISGDGSGLVLDQQKGWALLGDRKVGGDQSMASNAVSPLPVDTGPPNVFGWKLQPGQAVVVATDGFGDPIGDGATPVAGYLLRAWAKPLKSIPELIRTSNFIRVQADDDRSAVVVWACEN